MKESDELICRSCKKTYHIPYGEGLRCPHCGSKERENLDFHDCEIVEFMIRDKFAIDLTDQEVEDKKKYITQMMRIDVIERIQNYD